MGGTVAALRRLSDSSSFGEDMQESAMAKLKPSLRIRKGRWKLFLALCRAYNDSSSNNALNLLVEDAISKWWLPGYARKAPPPHIKKLITKMLNGGDDEDIPPSV